jgi:nicotinate phosphoribosyltransferase
MKIDFEKVFSFSAPVSILDTDLYKLTMLQYIWTMSWDHVPTTFRFIERNRENQKSENLISPEIYKFTYQVLNEWVKSAKFSDSDLEYLKTILDDAGEPVFRDNFLEYLKTEFSLSPLKFDEENLILSTEGSWASTTLWEIYVLSTINAIYNLSQVPNMIDNNFYLVNAETRLLSKIDTLKSSYLKPNISDFGTRRRHSFNTHRYILKRLKKEKIISATSNVYFAREFDLKPVGTFAHEIPMGAMGINDLILDEITEEFNYKYVYKPTFVTWKKLNGKGFHIALTDTYGSKKFFDYDLIDLSWDGVRHDSGCPFQFTELVLDWISRQDQELKRPFKIVYSDGLTFSKILEIQEKYGNHPQLELQYGIGTNLTNDVNITPIPIVMKLTEIDGASTVKLSDNLNKAISYGKKSKINIERYRKIFGHNHNQKQELYV